MSQRSNRREVRNPLLALPAMKKLMLWPPEYRADLVDLLTELAVDCDRRAQASWRKSKAPMAAYWQAVKVYAKHLRSAVRP